VPERKRDIILLSYFLELTDGEIGKKLNMMRSTVQYKRTTTLQELRRFMEGENADEQNENNKK
jgi:DNA-directed RNA polymerase specialized sigma24 family protein